MMHTGTPVTVLGLGLMGGALAGAFLRAGHPTTVWNRTTAKADDLVARGATLAGSPAAAIAAAPLVVVCVSDYDAVTDVLDGPLDGRIVVNLTSGTPSRARALAEEVARRGGGYLDGGIMAVPDAVGTADAVLVYSGPRPLYDAHEATLGGLGTGLHLGDDPGLSATYEMATLVLMWGMLDGFLNGVAILGTAGVSATAYLPIARRAVGTVAGWLPDYARQADDGSYPADDGTVDTHLAAMAHVVEESESLGVNTQLPRLVKALAERAVTAGHGASGYAALVEQFRTP
ncbi:3-hydroxyisobutyrate dehydrogenase-like beta-hydroxyacid dehydrogenase [Streptomyces africanus]|uniref:3-hydroxyisobutyrate dehydrogenase-like beta-hydroxyacid dehydrogenase n=2 Tax=Streptomyces africanus TaxID=231024 RepID=A0ABU0QF83_9ACTN|nr:NAD(P)-binding domain-containing protein [Streptomyces africanus]MDQ0746038.1 3-hydroxyisobutyrate dehydrogenase-like beta-hydroxyacid dehydrogenase [Streptomyces africanus]